MKSIYNYNVNFNIIPQNSLDSKSYANNTIRKI